jgi:hypothetical protein
MGHRQTCKDDIGLDTVEEGGVVPLEAAGTPPRAGDLDGSSYTSSRRRVLCLAEDFPVEGMKDLESGTVARDTCDSLPLHTTQLKVCLPNEKAPGADRLTTTGHAEDRTASGGDPFDRAYWQGRTKRWWILMRWCPVRELAILTVWQAMLWPAMLQMCSDTEYHCSPNNIADALLK